MLCSHTPECGVVADCLRSEKYCLREWSTKIRNQQKHKVSRVREASYWRDIRGALAVLADNWRVYFNFSRVSRGGVGGMVVGYSRTNRESSRVLRVLLTLRQSRPVLHQDNISHGEIADCHQFPHSELFIYQSATRIP